MKWKAVFVATVLDGAVLRESIRIEAAALDGQRVVDDQLRFGTTGFTRAGSPPCCGDSVAQSGEVDERGLAQNVVAHHARRKPGKVVGRACVR
jgi:hypothetical protein